MAGMDDQDSFEAPIIKASKRPKRREPGVLVAVGGICMMMAVVFLAQWLAHWIGLLYGQQR